MGNTKVSWQEVYLADCGSTHGTFLDKRRFDAGIPYIIGNGEVITFGQRVTSGASELIAISKSWSDAELTFFRSYIPR